MPKRPNVDAIEFLKGRIYLGAYDYQPQNTDKLVYFTVEDSLPYNPFHLDFGPLHIGHLYRFAVVLHNILNDNDNRGKAVVFYSSGGSRERANAATLLCCYMILVQNWSPHQVLHPICQCDPPFMPFRDAGYSHADFEITIQDVVYSMWRAKERNMIDITSFNLEEYEQYERVDQGDFNVISKDFIAFASPQQARAGAPLNEPFTKVLEYFVKNNVKLVVRLNSHLYDSTEFIKRGIQHIDMIFDDGTCPTMEYVQKFIGAAECVINAGGKIAVHCKAGLGRTGCLIGAHLIYTHGFTANECISYMRMIRPGMVVGPQQHWLYLHQNEFRDWRHTMVLDSIPDDSIGGLYSLISYEEFKNRNRKEKKILQSEEIANMNLAKLDTTTATDTSPATPVRRRKFSGQLKSAHRAVPLKSPGQPRKSSPQRSQYYNTNNSDDDEYVSERQIEQENYNDQVNHDHKVNTNDVDYIEASEQVIPSSSPQKSGGSNRTVSNVLDGSTSNQQWRVLRSITNPGNGSTANGIQLTKTRTTTTTTRTTTIASSPPPYQAQLAERYNLEDSLKIPKGRSRTSSGARVRSRLSSQTGAEKIIGSGGVRKASLTRKSP
ncbi:hypothetical protein PACTADRAFT_48494 [Pachysolen tannophilus NRRL Y-2460]|uniref:Tyrosine-protein phosphatase CDC14 n=1 Tax=Pachysolen tannophilus NRRL Y-2460 TaxID=669874 RepID=A0A1E4TY66_PACTA|nr:hypothetical protein PACTADRAFT_48494 [Pachysolen tannophilus NRRL Y-2460]